MFMKSVTEFASFTLTKGLSTKAALTTEGKTPEEIQQGLGEAFKLEGDKLKYFITALDVASQHSENLKRVLVVSLAEGESAPSKATKVEELHFVPDFHVSAKPAASADDKNRPRGKGGGRRGGNEKKGSPWGLSPEEKAAKKGPAATPNKK
jgi:hypothetical protein